MLKNAIYSYFDTMHSNKRDKVDDLCPIVSVKQVKLIDNFTDKKGMTSHCYRIAYHSMERSLTDEQINDLQWNVREQVQNKLNVVLR
ncbi:hypothetical protein CsSME_00029667 [Camellia sinensis var. sinensis]